LRLGQLTPCVDKIEQRSVRSKFKNKIDKVGIFEEFKKCSDEGMFQSLQESNLMNETCPFVRCRTSKPGAGGIAERS
jgi:hypothetical protein